MKTAVSVNIVVHCKDSDAGMIIQQVTNCLGDVSGQVIAVSAVTNPMPDIVVEN